MKRPWFPFYTGDWLRNAKLRRCSPAARGVWMDVLCLLHDSADEYGVLRWPLKDIAMASGASMVHIRELVDKEVLKGADAGKKITSLIFTPISGRKKYPSVVLLEEQEGPLWYSSRMVEDEYKRLQRAGKSDSPDTSPKPPFSECFDEAPKPTPDLSPSTRSESEPYKSKNTHSLREAPDERVDLADPDHWLPDPERLNAQLAFAGIPPPSDAELRQVLAVFNPKYPHLSGSARYAKLIQWLIGDHRNATENHPVRTASGSKKPRRGTPVEQAIEANAEYLRSHGIDPAGD